MFIFPRADTMPDRAWVTEFSTNLFWDVDPTTLDLDQHRKYVVARVVECGTFEDWKLLCRHFGLPTVVSIAQTLRSLDARAVSFLSVVGHVTRDSFRCSTQTPSTPSLWNC